MQDILYSKPYDRCYTVAAGGEGLQEYRHRTLRSGAGMTPPAGGGGGAAGRLDHASAYTNHEAEEHFSSTNKEAE